MLIQKFAESLVETIEVAAEIVSRLFAVLPLGLRPFAIGPSAASPCPALQIRVNKVLFGMVLAEAEHGMQPMTQKSLGIGCGCSMPDADATEAQFEEFDQVSFIKIYGYGRKAA